MRLGLPTGVVARMLGMRVGVIDVGSNSVRLLVASVSGTSIRTVREEREHLGLAEEILRHGRVRRRKLDEVAELTGDYARIARKLGARELETVVTAPGRQGDSPERLLDTLGRATASEVRVLSGEEEGKLSFAGALAHAPRTDGVIAVCDVGGGSTEIAVGTHVLGPAWVRSLDLGSLRLTAALLADDPATGKQIEAARAAVGDDFADIVPPRPDFALATGGSARAVGRLVGGAYGAQELEHVVERLSCQTSEENAKQLGLRPDRARTLIGGALILAEVSRRLDQLLTPARGGLREGTALRLAAQRVAA